MARKAHLVRLAHRWKKQARLGNLQPGAVKLGDHAAQTPENRLKLRLP